MIPQSVVDEIRRLLGEGRLSQRKIAREVGVSRGSVGGIASGKRPDYADRERRRSEEALAPGGPFVRCDGCGHSVQLPCQICRARATGRVPRAAADPHAEGLRLELSGEALARYEEIRRGAPAERGAAA
ncbi:MAG: hypothetical protein PHU85_00030 [Phycisphaerae bacterium]|nr:hypothetical protein [Phycisphaerae bacterium]